MEATGEEPDEAAEGSQGSDVEASLVPSTRQASAQHLPCCEIFAETLPAPPRRRVGGTRTVSNCEIIATLTRPPPLCPQPQLASQPPPACPHPPTRNKHVMRHSQATRRRGLHYHEIDYLTSAHCRQNGPRTNDHVHGVHLWRAQLNNGADLSLPLWGRALQYRRTDPLWPVILDVEWYASCTVTLAHVSQYQYH